MAEMFQLDQAIEVHYGMTRTVYRRLERLPRGLQMVPLWGGHRALDDCLAALERIKRIAANDDKFHCPVPRPE
jgi:inhibitor of KinA sporulation pathway (predicted exonuclease)